MKRSEMLEKYSNDEKLDYLLMCLYQGDNFGIFEEVFERCLSIAEEAGMLPPETLRKLTKEELDSFNKLFAYGTDQMTEDDTITDFCWEPEDD